MDIWWLLPKSECNGEILDMSQNYCLETHRFCSPLPAMDNYGALALITRPHLVDLLMKVHKRLGARECVPQPTTVLKMI